jgi:1-acyl-sn-glycerol-3-phosphate acyltransferase
MAEDTILTEPGAITTRLRGYWKLLILLETLAEEAVRFGLLRIRVGRSLTLRDRARWLSSGSARILRRVGFVYRAPGAAPSSGLLVSNHLSHLDVLFYATAYQCIFVAKHEVSRWPVFGWFARWGGTVFVRRERPQDAVLAGRLIEAALRAGVPIMLFPEGTSTDGSALLPFRPFLFEPAVRMAAPVTACAIGYSAVKQPESALCYYGDVPFAPHLISCLGLTGVRAVIASAPAATYASRKEAAAETQRLVEELRVMQAP